MRQMDVPTTGVAAILTKTIPSPHAAHPTLSTARIPLLHARFHSAPIGGSQEPFALRFGLRHRDLDCFRSGRRSIGGPISINSNRHTVELELPVTYRKQRIGKFLIDKFRTFFRFAILSLRLIPHGFSQRLQRPYLPFRPNRFGLAANYSPVTIGI